MKLNQDEENEVLDAGSSYDDEEMEDEQSHDKSVTEIDIKTHELISSINLNPYDISLYQQLIEVYRQ